MTSWPDRSLTGVTGLSSEGGVTRSAEGQATRGGIARRGRVVRSRTKLIKWVVFLALISVAYAVLVLGHRDTVRMNKALETLEPFRVTLQASLDATGQLPLKLSDTDPNGNPLPSQGFTYLPADAIHVLRGFDGPVMVGHSTYVATGLRTGGWAVLFCDHGQCSVRWERIADFLKRKAEQEAWVQNRRRELLERGPRLP